MVIMALVSVLGPLWSDYFSLLAPVAIVLLFAGLLVGVVVSGKPRFRRLSSFAFLFFASGAAIIFGAFLFLTDNQMHKFAILIPAIVMFPLVVLASIWVSKTQERMAIFVDGGYSVELVRDLAKRIEDSLSRKGLPFTKRGNSFQLDSRNKERVFAGVRVVFGENETKYQLILSTNRSRRSGIYTSLRVEISDIVHDIEGEGFDSYPKVKRAVCRKCRRDVSYIYSLDQFYCNKCRDFRKDKDVHITRA